MDVGFRRARAADVDEIVTLHAQAFPDDRTDAARARALSSHPHGGLDDLWVAEEGARRVAFAFLFSLQAWFGGAAVRVGGVSTMGVAPWARGRGIASRLLTHLEDQARDDGNVALVVYPFHDGFYARRGYATTTAYRRLVFAPAAIGWRPEIRIRDANGNDRMAMAQCWHEWGSTRTGVLVRTERAWEARLLDRGQTWLVAESDRGVEGYVVWSLLRKPGQFDTELTIDEMATRSDRARRSLWAAVAAQRDQVARVRAPVSDDDAIEHSLVDPGRTHVGSADVERIVGDLVAGPRVRVLDARGALAARGWREDGSWVVGLGPHRFRVEARAGRAEVAETHEEADLALDPVTLAAVAFGAVPLSRAASLGGVTMRDAGKLAAADAFFSLPPFFAPNAF